MAYKRSVLAYGDSNTWGLIPGSDPQERFPRDIRWTGLLQEKLSDTVVVEEGLCGRTTVFEDALRPGRRGVSTLPFILESQRPLDAAVLMLGTNDCKSHYGASAHTIGRGIELCLDELMKYLPASKILLLSPILLGEDVWKPAKDPEFGKASVSLSRELKAVYSEIASRRGVAFLAASDHAVANPVDDEHLDEDGHRALADAVAEKLSQIL